MIVSISYKRYDNKNEFKMAPTNNNNYYYYYVVSDSKSVEEAKEIFFEEIDDKIEVTPKITLNPKVA